MASCCSEGKQPNVLIQNVKADWLYQYSQLPVYLKIHKVTYVLIKTVPEIAFYKSSFSQGKFKEKISSFLIFGHPEFEHDIFIQRFCSVVQLIYLQQYWPDCYML